MIPGVHLGALEPDVAGHSGRIRFRCDQVRGELEATANAVGRRSSQELEQRGGVERRGALERARSINCWSCDLESGREPLIQPEQWRVCSDLELTSKYRSFCFPHFRALTGEDDRGAHILCQNALAVRQL